MTVFVHLQALSETFPLLIVFSMKITQTLVLVLSQLSESRSATTKTQFTLSQEVVGSTLANEESINMKRVMYSEKWRDRRAFTEGLEMLADTQNKKE